MEYCTVEKKYFVFCSCKRCDASCVPCVHQINVMELFGALRLRDLTWHPRVSNGYYYSALVSCADVTFNPTAPWHPHLSEVSVNEWRHVHEKSASTVGIPVEGLIDGDFNHDPAGDNGDFSDGNDGGCARAKQSKRTPAYNAAFSQRMHQAIEGALPASSPLWRDYCVFQRQFFDDISRRSVTFSGVGASVRKRGLADVAQGRGGDRKKKGNNTDAVDLGRGAAASSSRVFGLQPLPTIAAPAPASGKRPFGWCLNFQGKKGQDAIDYLARWGAMETWIVEVYPDDKHPDYHTGDRWFMTISDGKVEGPEGKQYITACRWNKANSRLELDPRWRDAEMCELQQVKG